MEGREGKWESSLKSHDSTSEQRSAAQRAVCKWCGQGQEGKRSGVLDHHPASSSSPV